MHNFSFFKKGITNKVPTVDISVERAIAIIRSEQYKEEIERLRRATDKSIREVVKRGLDYFTFSGTFKTRHTDHLLKHSGILSLDLDPYRKNKGKEPELVNPLLLSEFDAIRQQLQTDPYTLAVFVSPSGTGYKVLIKIRPEKHLQSFYGLEKYYFENFNLKLDKGVNDIARACFVSYDPNAFLNTESKLCDLFLDERTTSDVQKEKLSRQYFNNPPANFSTDTSLQQARHVVAQIVEKGIDITSGYDEWRDIGFALSTLGEDGRDLFHQVSQFHPDYSQPVTDRRFDEALKKSRFDSPAKFFAIAKSYNIDIRMPAVPKPPVAAAPVQPAYQVSERDATPDEQENDMLPEVRDHFTNQEIETVLSKFTLKDLGWKPADPNNSLDPYIKIKPVFKDYHWFPLISFSVVKNRKVTKYIATDKHPIFLIDEESHKLIYQPTHPDKNLRFQTFGKPPAGFIHGLVQLKKVFDDKKAEIDRTKQEQAEDDDRGDKKAKKKDADPRIPKVIYCRGCSDAINVAMLRLPDTRVIWVDSPTATLTDYQYNSQLKTRVDKLYHLHNIDAQGKATAHKMAMDNLDIFNIELPEDLLKLPDTFGEPSCDARAYLNHYKEWDFRQLLDTALPYRFWEKKPKYSGRGEASMFVGWDYEIDNVQLYNFLQKSGFWRLSYGDKKTDWMYIQITGNTVLETTPDNIRSFLKKFLRSRMVEKSLLNALFNSTKLNESSLSYLDEINLDFSDFDKHTQYMFFQNATIEVTKDEIKTLKPGDIPRYIWKEELHPHNFRDLEQEPFSITMDKFGTYNIDLYNTDCLFLKYLIQGSRVHWRTELEGDKFKALSEIEQKQYLADNHCTLTGPLLTPEEHEEQKLHLVNKIFTIGFLMHRYKNRRKAWFAYGMDDKIPEDGRSHGGSGKSIMFDMAIRSLLRKNFTVNGRDSKLNDNSHKYEGVTEYHRYVLIEDSHKYVKLDVFFKDITGDMNVNPKGKKAYSIEFEKSPKLAFTSNFPPYSIDSSILRRILFVVFSDYYHTAGETNDYKETRDPGTDLGKTLFTDFIPDEWNLFYNTAAHCLRFYLGTNEKIEPVMTNVTKRNLISTMGQSFLDWAEAHFSEEGDKLDKELVREEIFTEYLSNAPVKDTPQQFMDRMRAYCRYSGYILNPKEWLGNRKKKIAKVMPRSFNKDTKTWTLVDGHAKQPKEIWYIQAAGKINHTPEDDEMPF